MKGNIEENGGKRTLFGRVAAIPGIDKTLTRKNMCADAKVTGDRINSVVRRLDGLDPHYASNVRYDNSKSKLAATQLQAAIDELAARISENVGGDEQ